MVIYQRIAGSLRVAAIVTRVVRFEHFSQIRAGNAVFVNRSADFVDDTANDTFAVGTTEVGTSQFNTFFQLLAGIVTWMGDQHDICVQSSRNFMIQLYSRKVAYQQAPSLQSPPLRHHSL